MFPSQGSHPGQDMDPNLHELRVRARPHSSYGNYTGYNGVLTPQASGSNVNLTLRDDRIDPNSRPQSLLFIPDRRSSLHPMPSPLTALPPGAGYGYKPSYPTSGQHFNTSLYPPSQRQLRPQSSASAIGSQASHNFTRPTSRSPLSSFPDWSPGRGIASTTVPRPASPMIKESGYEQSIVPYPTPPSPSPSPTPEPAQQSRFFHSPPAQPAQSSRQRTTQNRRLLPYLKMAITFDPTVYNVPRLSGPNFREWDSAIRSYLFAWDCLAVLDGSYREPFRREIRPDCPEDQDIVHPPGEFAGANSVPQDAVVNGYLWQPWMDEVWERWRVRELRARGLINLTVDVSDYAEIRRMWCASEIYDYLKNKYHR